MPIRKHFLIQKKYYLKNFFGAAHLRALNLVERYPGISLGELIFKLKVTKQSLKQSFKRINKIKMIKQIKDDSDTRRKNLFLDKEGKVFLKKFMNLKKKNF